MKLSNFLLLAGLGLALASVGLWRACSSHDDEPTPSARVAGATVDAGVARRAEIDAAVAAPPVDEPALAARVHDAEVLGWRTRTVSGGKGKDVSKGRPYKVNVYQDTGKTRVNRAKVDLDRDDKFDEKYTFDGDAVVLQIAPADDEQYTETYHWTGDGWDEGATAAPPPPSTPPATPESFADLPARSYDAEVLGYRGKALGSDKRKDVSSGRAYKINVYQDAGQTTANRAKVDVDRDDKFDEKYTFDGETITLERAPADDERYTETYHWTGDGWRKAK